MLNFLRKLRRNEMKSGRYLKYAIGEIFLVMIGILLALQVSNWNQAIKDRKLEEDYYCRLLEDIQQDEVKMNEQLARIAERVAAANKVISLLQGPDVGLKELVVEIRKSVSRNDFQLTATTSAFEDIKSSGNLNLLRDIEVKKELVAYYDNLHGLFSTINQNMSAINTTRFFMHDDLLSAGWVEIANDQGAFDTSLVDIEKLRSLAILSPEKKLQLLNDAVFSAATNSRNAYHFSMVEVQIKHIRSIMKSKCSN